MPASFLKSAFFRSRRLCRPLAVWVFLPLCLLILSSAASLYLLCRYQPEMLADGIQQYVHTSTGLLCRIRGGVTPMLAPLPGLSLSDVRLYTSTAERSVVPVPPLMQVQTLRVFLDLEGLFSWPFRLAGIELDHPVINLASGEQRPPSQRAQDGSEAAAPVVSQDLSEQASAQEKGEPRPDPSLREAANFLCSLPLLIPHPVSIRNGRLTSCKPDGNPLFSFSDLDGKFIPGAEKDNLILSTRFLLPGADLDMRVTLSARLGREGIPAIGTISGQIDMTPPGSRTLSGFFASSFRWLDNGKDLLLPDFRIVAETDALSANLAVDLAGPVCTGKVFIHQLSLPRWFEFGRVLPPGLRQTLDGLIGDFDLVLDPHRAEAHNLKGVVGSLFVNGYVGTPDFSAPVVVVDLDVDKANLDPIFPFLAAVGRFVPDPTPPVFDHPPLAPYPREPRAPPPDESTIDVSYAVSVRVARPRVHDVDSGPLSLTVLPAIVQNVSKSRVAFTIEDILGGKAEARLDIDEHAILMYYDAYAMDLRFLPENRDNQTRVSGKVTGSCFIDVPMLANSDLADNWKLTVDAAVHDFSVNGRYAGSPWGISAETASVAGAGNIFAVPSKGVRIEGLWNLDTKRVKSSWYPRGKDAAAGSFKGGLHWLPFGDEREPAATQPRKMERKGVEKVAGALHAKGTFVVPLAGRRVPVTGMLSTNLDWRIYDESISLENTRFEGFGSYVEGVVDINFAGSDVKIRSEALFKINPRRLLKSWNLLPPPSVRAPEVLTGRTDIAGSGQTLKFERIKAEMEGAPITGDITWQETGSRPDDPGSWTFRLTADHLNLDNIFPPASPDAAPAPPDATPWDSSPLQGLSLDAQIFLHNFKWEKLTSSRAKITATLQKNRFSLHGETAEFYKGKSTVLLQGTLSPKNSPVLLHKCLARMEGVNLNQLLYDYTRDTSYGGTADLVLDLSGALSSSADMPGNLSGDWRLEIKDGLYPAILSRTGSPLRSTFSQASASGRMEKGVLRWNNFILSGPLVEMAGGGWMDLTTKKYDIEISATYAKVPTVPIRLYGSTSTPRMRVRGIDMVVETVQNAGTSLFGLIWGVMRLPDHVARGIGSLFEKDTLSTEGVPAATDR